jgi:hypothetical protein
MVKVEIYIADSDFQTDVWAATDNVIRRMLKLAKKKKKLVLEFQGLLQRAAKTGFDTLPSSLLKHEFDNVYAFGNRQGSLLRAGGFFHEPAAKRTFVLMDFFEKHGQKLRASERKRLQEIGRIRDCNEWRLVIGR